MNVEAAAASPKQVGDGGWTGKAGTGSPTGEMAYTGAESAWPQSASNRAETPPYSLES